MVKAGIPEKVAMGYSDTRRANLAIDAGVIYAATDGKFTNF